MVAKGIRFLDEVVIENADKHPLPQQSKVAEDYRQIGLGIFAFADLLVMLGVRYGSPESMKIADKLGFEMINQAATTSALIAKEKGTFPKYNETMLESPFLKENLKPEVYKIVEEYGLRNASLLSIAPTGSISTMLGRSGGIEPIFSISYNRKTESLHEEGEVTYEVFTPVIKDLMEAKDILDKKDLPDYVVSANDIHYKDRIDIQSAWQEYIDNAISSTLNLPNDITINEVKNAYIYGWKQGLKGMTVYREGCKRAGILTNSDDVDNEDMTETDWVEAGICPECKSNLDRTQGCKNCNNCGWSACSV